jgi:exosortase O
MQAGLSIPTVNDRARHMANIALACAALPAWLWFVRDLWPHLSVLATGEDFRTNQLLFAGIAALLLYRARRHSLVAPATPAMHLPGLLAFALGAGGYVFSKRVLDVNTPAAVFAGLALYALLGAWLPAQRWLRGLPAALLLIGALPLGDFADVFIGYPLRAFTAGLVSSAFGAAGIAGIRADTILVFENGIAHVDVPCSGVKSLWTGGLFLLAATWIEQRAITWRWLLAAIAFALVLVMMNVLRVALLSLMGQVLGLRTFAEMLHVPLGVVAFAASCAAGWWLLQRAPRWSHTSASKVENADQSPLLRDRSDSAGQRGGATVSKVKRVCE